MFRNQLDTEKNARKGLTTTELFGGQPCELALLWLLNKPRGNVVSNEIFKKKMKKFKMQSNMQCLKKKSLKPMCVLIPGLCSPLHLPWQRYWWAEGLCWNWKSVEMHF